MPINVNEYNPRFMQLNPARGRKRNVNDFMISPLRCPVYAAQPREGTETGTN